MRVPKPQYKTVGPINLYSFSDLSELVTQAATDRWGEAIGPFRRALSLGAPPTTLWPLLAKAFHHRGRYLAALSCVREARTAGVDEADLSPIVQTIEEKLGSSLTAWRSLVLATPSR